jgi:hypothetical protein
MKRRVIPPRRGAANNTSAYDTPSEFCPVENIDNVFLFDVAKDRPRMGSRPGLEDRFPGVYGDGEPWQGLGTVNRSKTATGYRLGSGVDVSNTAGEAKDSAPVLGQVWALDKAWGLFRFRYEDVSPSGPVSYGPDTGPANQSVSAVCISPDGSKAIFASNYVDASTRQVSRITCWNLSTGAVVWSQKITDTVARFTNSVACNAEWVFVCTNQYVGVYKLADGTAPSLGGQFFNMNGWSDECVKGVLDAAGKLIVAFKGSSVAATLPSGIPVTTGKRAQHFRAGVMRFNIRTVAQVAAALGDVIYQDVMANKLIPADQFYEANHGYCRFSEHTPKAPKGCQPTGVAATPDGGFVLTHTNEGWGPRGSAGPGNAPPNGVGGYWTVTKFNSAGAYEWRTDTDSILEAGDGGYNNDIPTSTSDLPSILAVAVGSDGVIYCGGRRNRVGADGVCAFAFDIDGTLLWEADLGATIREGAICIMPTEQVPVFAGDRNSTWDGSGGANAHLWELRPLDGGVARYFDLSAAVSALAVAGRADGSIVYGTDKV